MTVQRWRAAIFLLGLGAGCGGTEPASSPSETGAAGEAFVRGSISSRDGVALPEDALVELWITDTSPGFVAQVLIAETSFPTAGRQMPLLFDLPYESGRIVPSHTYGLHAAISSEERLLYATEAPVPVITQGHPSEDVELRVMAPGEEIAARIRLPQLPVPPQG